MRQRNYMSQDSANWRNRWFQQYAVSFQAGVLIALNEIMGENKLTAASFSMTAWGLYILVLFGLSFYYIPQDQRSMLQFANEADFLEKK